MSDDDDARYQALKSEYEEFKTESQELENAMDEEIQRTQDDNTKLKAQLNRVKEELTKIRSESSDATARVSREMAALQMKNQALQKQNEEFLSARRAMEEKHSQLERKFRISSAALESKLEELETTQEDYYVLREEFDEYKTDQVSEMEHFKEHIRDLSAEIERLHASLEHAKSQQNQSKQQQTPFRTPKGLSTALSSPPSSQPHPVVHLSTSLRRLPSLLPHSYLNQNTNNNNNNNNNNTNSNSHPQKRQHSRGASMPVADITMGHRGKQLLQHLFSGANSGDDDDHSNNDAVADANTLPPKTPQQNTSKPIAVPSTAPSKVGNADSAFVSAEWRRRAQSMAVESTSDPSRDPPPYPPQKHRERAMSNFESKVGERYKFMLIGGALFRKYRHGNQTKRWIWCSQTLDHVMWGNHTAHEIRGCLRVDDIANVTAGTGKRDKMIFLVTRRRTLELEADNINMRRDWMGAFRYLLVMQKQKESKWAHEVSTGQVEALEEQFTRYAFMLQKGKLFTKWKGKSRKQRLICFDENMERLQWIEPESKKLKGFIHLADICDVDELFDDADHPTRMVIMAVRRNLVLEASTIEVKKSWIGAIRFLIRYYTKLRDNATGEDD